VRYLLELFQDVVAPELNTRLDELTRLQTRLGKIIDCVVARDLVRGLRGENKLAELAKLKRQQFADFWETDFYPAWSL
jgi:CHAD domain-containing protein